ncbi:M60 family metallopeptidase [Mycoplasmopsis iners]|uniref:M60 family metallopeptidase n=1 Tax=Mycoplasmopsis iners TaxID=76630 RepID=UPI0004982878|nr:M60 family metallopeptidase [Mycoplasmopsis iners]
MKKNKKKLLIGALAILTPITIASIVTTTLILKKNNEKNPADPANPKPEKPTEPTDPANPNPVEPIQPTDPANPKPEEPKSLTSEETNLLFENASAIVENNGYFTSTTGALNINIEGLDNSQNDLVINQYSWSSNNVFLKNTTVPQLQIKYSDIGADTTYSVAIKGTYNNKIFVKTFDNLNVHKFNPLSEVILQNRDNVIITDENPITLTLNETTNLDLSKTQWFYFDKKLDQIGSSSYQTNRPGTYYAIVFNNEGLSWKTNELEIENNNLQNIDPSFAANLSAAFDIVTYQEKFLGYESRENKINNQVYETDLLNRYSSQGFRYPGWEYNYEGNKDENSFMTLDGKRVNISDLVFAERVPGTNFKYSSPQWIKSQIASNQLKKHPAAALWYQKNVTNETKSLTKEFKIDGSVSGSNALGLYIPAGEIAEIEFDTETYNIFKNEWSKDLPIKIHINQNYWDNRPFNNSAKISNRYPFVQSTFTFQFSEIDPNTRRIKVASPFGGSLSFELKQNFKYNRNGDFASLKFKVYGAVEQFHYVYDQTTEEEWNKQISKIKNGEITAPVASIQTNYSSILVPFTSPTSVAGVELDNMVFPEEIFKKWNSFYEMSYYWGDYWNPKIALNYCDDIWDGAGAWGGLNNLWAAVSWAKGYYDGKSLDFGFTNWGNYHEINHNFEQHQDPFHVNNHGWTNIPSTVDLSFINDKTRLRNFANFTGDLGEGWSRLANGYILNTKKTNNQDWYSLYANMIYQYGPMNFANWTKASGKSGNSGKFFTTITYLADYFKLNPLYALKQYAPSVTTGETLQKNFKVIKEINGDSFRLIPVTQEDQDKLNKYPAFDFVSSIYAVGNYLYNSETGNFEYTSDTMPAFQIPAGEDYVFDFEKGIASFNPNFKIKNIQVPTKTKLGNSLTIDANNKFKVTYHANANTFAEIDEFDLDIIPDEFDTKPSNYVPMYKMKIKIRNVVNRPVMKLYPRLNSDVNSFDELYAAYSEIDQNDIVSFVQDFNFDELNYLSNKQNTLLESTMKFVAPKTGTFEFKALADDWSAVWVDNQLVGSSLKASNSEQTLGSFEFVKGQIYEIKLAVYNQGGAGNMNFWLANGTEKINLVTNSITPTLETNNLNEDQLRNLIENPTYQYQRRYRTNESKNKTQISRYIKNLGMADPKFSVKRMSPNTPDSNKVFDNNIDTHYERFYDNADKNRPVRLIYRTSESFKANFIDIYPRQSYWRWFVPNELTVTIKEKNSNELHMQNIYYDFSSRYSNASYQRVFFGRVYDIEEITIEARNTFYQNDKYGITLAEIKYGLELNTDSIIPINSENNKFYGHWEIISSEKDGVESPINGFVAKSVTANDYIKIPINSPEIVIMGQKGQDMSTFDVYFDDELVGRDISASNQSNNTLLFNELLFLTKITDTNVNWNDSHTLKIVNKENKPLVLTFISYKDIQN